MPNVISLYEPGARQYLRRTNAGARLGRLCRAVWRDWYASEAIPERDPSYRLPEDLPATMELCGVRRTEPESGGEMAGQQVVPPAETGAIVLRD
jgi:hypothetical protein